MLTLTTVAAFTAAGAANIAKDNESNNDLEIFMAGIVVCFERASSVAMAEPYPWGFVHDKFKISSTL